MWWSTLRTLSSPRRTMQCNKATAQDFQVVDGATLRALKMTWRGQVHYVVDDVASTGTL